MGASSSSNSFVSAAHAIEGGLKEGHVITIKGTFLKSKGTRFAVNFHMGFSDDDIAFQFNPRFEGDGYVVCNTKQKGWWEQEEKIMRNPFPTEKPFEIRILVEISRFQVMVNGDHFVDYEHRVPLHRANYMTVTGPVEQIDIRFQRFDEILTVKCCQTPCYPREPKKPKGKPPSYWQATSGLNLQSTPGQMFPNPIILPLRDTILKQQRL